MIIVRILGGLGNQMFQYACAKALEQKGYHVKLDISGFKKYKLHGGYHLNKYQIDLKKASNFSNFLSKITFFKHKKEKSLIYDATFKSLKGNEYVKGYFQTEKYFSEIRSLLLKQFTISDTISNSTKEYEKQILETTNTCSLHIRRGDYVSNSKSNSIHGTCSLEYYREAIKIINAKHKNSIFLVFSDDTSWAKENLLLENAVYIDHKTIPHEDLYLMSLCKHNITANSSFSWWGAWLNQNKNKIVIAPKKWYLNKENEIASKHWITI